MNTPIGAAMPNAESTLKHAERLLREAAAEWKDGISINGVPDWQNEPDTAAAYRESCAVADALAALGRVETFQQRVQPWLMECFGPMIAGDREERNHRLLEEALELVQACGCSASEAHQLVDYVFGRPVGEPAQEVGGVMVTLAALCLANGLDMNDAAEVELARIWTKVDAIRAKQAGKPKHSPLPMSAAPQAQQINAALADGADDGDVTSREQYKRMFHAACADLGEINEALGLDPDDGGAEPILAAISELKSAALADGWISVDDDLPSCDGEAVYIGENSSGHIACFNEHDGMSNCFMVTPDENTHVLSELVAWKRVHRRALPTLNASKEGQ